MGITRDELVARLTRAGELELSGEEADPDSYFDTDQFRFHGPGGLETDYAGLMSYFNVRSRRVRRSLHSARHHRRRRRLHRLPNLDRGDICP